MLEKQFVEDLVENARVHSAFAVKEKSLVAFRSKPGKFLNLVLTDRTGEITARVWDHAEEMAETFEPGDVVVVKGAVQDYQGQLQLIASQVTPAAIDEYDMEDLVPTAGRSREELERWLDATIERVVNPDLRALLDAFFQEPGFREQMATAFGARSLHHSYAGGLLEHTLSVVQLLLAAAEIHPEMDKDLLITGGLLHDIGKLEELAGVTVADYTDVGKFIGHTVLSDRMIQERIRSIEDRPAPGEPAGAHGPEPPRGAGMGRTHYPGHHGGVCPALRGQHGRPGPGLQAGHPGRRVVGGGVVRVPPFIPAPDIPGAQGAHALRARF